MTETGSTAFADPELSELFDGEPELLAIADAITATTPKGAEGKVAASDRRAFPRRTRSVVAAAVLLTVVAATPALAFSTTVRELVGLQTKSVRGPVFVARVTGVFVHGPNRPGTLVTVTFTVGEQGMPPGTGVPQGSSFLVLVSRTRQLAPAYGKDGHYRATTRLGPGGLTGIQIGGFMPSKGSRGINGGFWILTIIDKPPH